MTRAIAIAAREIRERKFVFLMAGLSALMPFMAALLPATKQSDPRSVIIVTSMVVAIGVTLGLAVILGGSIVSRELAEKRLSFYLSKPVSPPAIWFGKLTGAIVIASLAFAIIFLPSFLVARSAWTQAWNMPAEQFVAAVLGAAAALLLISHMISTMVRSRSPLIALDLALLATTLFAMWLLVRLLIVNLAVELAMTVAAGVVAAALLAIMAGGAWQISRGRTDIKRSHRELSRFFWTTMAAIVAIAAAYVGWVFSAGPEDLVNRDVQGNSRGDWIIIHGNARGRGDYSPSFLINVANGESRRFPAAQWGGGTFTHGGDAVIAVAPESRNVQVSGNGEIHLFRFDSPHAPTGTGIDASIWSNIVLSDDLRRMAVIDKGILTVYDLGSKAILGSVLLPPAQQASLFFLTPDLVRVLSSRYATASNSPHDLRILEFNVPSRRLEQTGQFTATATSVLALVSHDGSVIAMNLRGVRNGPGVLLLDGRTATQMGALDGSPSSSNARPLSNGLIARIQSTSGTAVLQIFDNHGNPVRQIALGSGGWGNVREVVPGRTLLVTLIRGEAELSYKRLSDTYVIDIERGVVQRVERGAYVAVTWFWQNDPRMMPPNPKGDYIVMEHGSAWRWNALTGVKTKVL
jgi:ABC-type transport system involved in multi-copper enzyme maturation permease subunit